MSNVIAFPARFDRKRKLSARDIIKNDDEDGVMVPFTMWVFTTFVETEAGIQYVAETISPRNIYAIGGTEASAIYRLVVCLTRKAP